MTSPATSTRQRILQELKLRGGASPSALAEDLSLTREAVRQQLAQLEAQGLVRSQTQTANGRGRPKHIYKLTKTGEAAFPKFHDALTVALLGAVDDTFGDTGLRNVLNHITDRQVALWQPRLEGKTLHKRLEALRGLYIDADPFTDVQQDADGAMLIEHNCPYLTAATSEPRLCSVTISTMKRLLGVEVERTERFQQGDGRCVFRIREDRPVDDDFRFEWETHTHRA